MQTKRNNKLHPASFFLHPKKGFTLVEMLVALAVFSIVILISGTALISLARASDKSHAILTAINNLDFAMEQMTRTIRVGHDFYCENGQHPIDPSPRDCRWGFSKNAISFTDTSDKRITYRLDETNGFLLRRHRVGTTDRTFSITSPEIDIQQMNFNVIGAPAEDGLQTRVIIRLQGRTRIKSLAEIDQVDFSLQTTVSARNFDF